MSVYPGARRITGNSDLWRIFATDFRAEASRNGSRWRQLWSHSAFWIWL